MRHRLFHAVVVMGAAACSSQGTSTNPPGPEVDSGGRAETAIVDSTAAETTATDSTVAADSKTAADTAVADMCVDEGCGCFPCIK